MGDIQKLIVKKFMRGDVLGPYIDECEAIRLHITALEADISARQSADEAIETLQQDLERDMTARRSSRIQNNFLQTQIDSLRQEREWLMLLVGFTAFGWVNTGLGWWLL